MFRIILFMMLFTCAYTSTYSTSYKITQVDGCTNVINLWMAEYLVLLKNTVGYSPPVAARTMNYLSIANYELAVDLLPSNNSLSGQLNGYKRTVWNQASEEFYYPHAINVINYEMSLILFANAPPFNKARNQKLYNDLIASYSSNTTNQILRVTEIYAKTVAAEIIEFSKTDGAHESWSKNFPSSYIPPKGPSFWNSTFPGVKPALLPYWGKNKLLVESNQSICKDISFLTFSTDTASEFFIENYKVYNLYKNISNEQELIAEYWDDSPGLSGTPIGHLYDLALRLSKAKDLSLKQTIELYVLLGISVNDAVIECWRIKYEYNLLRPITYIQKYISKDFKSVIDNPPFPEFPSGHSFQAGAACEVFKFIFSDSTSFTDSAQVNRTDINGTPRSFTNFSAMAIEMSTSRFYGGIHYNKTLEISLKYGGMIGSNTILMLNLNK